MGDLAAKGAAVTLLYPSLLWLLIPLAILWYYRPQKLTDTVHLVILGLIVLALTRPVADQEPIESEVEARDIIVAMDVSYSMRARDISPSRYDYAKAVINHLLASNQTDNIMLIAFTTNPLLLSPPTTDHALISVAMESLDPDNILTHGTSLKRLLKKIADLPIEEKNLILLSDGGEEKDLDMLSRIIQENGIRLTILAPGTTAGTTIEKENGSLLKDSEGNLVVSRINPLLERLAASSGGSYIPAPSDPKFAAEAIEEGLRSQAAEHTTVSKMQHYALELYPLPLFIALLLFLLLHTRAVKYLLPLAALWGTWLNASLFDSHYLHQAYETYQTGDYNATERYLKKVQVPSLQSRMAKANTYYKQKRYKKALSVYRSIRSTSPKIKQRLYYNIANCYAQTKAYDKARKYYIKALQLGDDADARYNLELVILKKSEADAALAFAHPTSQGSASGKAGDKDEESEADNREQQNSGSGGGGGQSKSKGKEKMAILQNSEQEKQPLGSKVYDLINKGYVNEKEPW